MASKPSPRIMLSALNCFPVGDWLNTDEIRHKIGAQSSTTYMVLQELVREGYLLRRQTSRNVRATYSITPSGVRWREGAANPERTERRRIGAASMLAKCLGYPS